MQTDSSASRTYLASRSASEWTTTVLILSSRHARLMRSAISPRLAIRIFPKSWPGTFPTTGDDAGRSANLGDHYERLTELHRLPILDQDLLHDARLVGLDLVHELHRFDDAQGVAGLPGAAGLDERFGARRRRAIEGADHRALDEMTLRLFGSKRRRGSSRSSRHARRCSSQRQLDRGRRRRGALRRGARDANPLLALLDFERGNPGSLDELNQGL